MICRRLKLDNNRQNVVWFGSYGVNLDGSAKFYNTNDIHDNYSDEKDAVCDSLIQRLSIIREELWYDIEYGLPLLEKTHSKLVIDSAALDIILSHPDVTNVLQYTSNLNQHSYHASAIIQTNFGQINFTI